MLKWFLTIFSLGAPDSVTLLVVLELFFSFRLPWVVHFILVGVLLSLKITDSSLEHAICHLLET